MQNDTFNQFSGLNLVIILVISIVMVVLTIIDVASMGKNNHKDFKSTLVSIGITGTFVGIFLGLWEFNTIDIKGSVPKLLEGMKIAFLTSILGMIIAIILTIWQKLKFSNIASDENPMAGMESKLDKLSSLPELFTENIDQIKNFRMESRDEQLKLREIMTDEFKKSNETLEKALDKLSEGATKEIITALENVIKDFNNNLTEQFGENFKELNQAVKELVQWQDNYKEHVVQTEKRVNGLMVEVELYNNQIAKVTQHAETFKQINSDLAQILTANKESSEELQKVFAKKWEIISKLNDSISSFDKGIEDAYKGIDKLSKNIKESVTEQSKSLTEINEALKSQLPESLGQLEKTLVGLTEKFGKDYGAFLEKVSQLTKVA
ncbi:MAG: hypothetical protein KDI92_14790 [Xanthomonadales bacterium]|nr:hypothetical protein [Xanthomonadales bacterium]MCB1584872.1 hypothetical protein [Xanthomonadales bacterium]